MVPKKDTLYTPCHFDNSYILSTYIIQLYGQSCFMSFTLFNSVKDCYLFLHDITNTDKSFLLLFCFVMLFFPNFNKNNIIYC